MATDLYQKVVDFVNGAFLRLGDDHNIRHFERTVHWLKTLKPDADEAFLIAAYAHDIERAFREADVAQLLNDPNRAFDDKEYVELHSNKGAKIVGVFLRKEEAPADLIERVEELISRHEVGGSEDQNLLKDVDSLSFFENNIGHFVTQKVAEHNKEKIRAKFDYMFNRITSEKAKNIARPWYEEGIKKLGY